MGSFTFYISKEKKKLLDWVNALPKSQISEAICEALEMHLPAIIDHRIAHHHAQTQRWQGVKSIHETKAAERKEQIKANLDKLAAMLHIGIYGTGTDKPRDSGTLKAWLYGHKPELTAIGLTEDEFINLAVAIKKSKLKPLEYLKRHSPIV